MEIIYMNRQNIKISLSKEDLDAEGLSADTLDYTSTRTKKLLWELLDAARAETGFDGADGKLYIRVFPAPDGSCELYVTKCTPSKDRLYSADAPVCDGFICLLEPEDDRLYALCRRLHAQGFRGNSSLYSLDDGRFVLMCENAHRLPSYLPRTVKRNDAVPDLGFAAEYGQTIPSDPSVIAYLGEHTKTVCADHAVERILMQ